MRKTVIMRNTIKLWISLTLVSAFLLSLSSCGYPGDAVRHSIGKYTRCEWYSSGGFQDYTDYGKFYYDSVDFSQNPYFQKIDASHIPILEEHLDDFENWVDLFRKNDSCQELVGHYDFDRSLIDCEDYLYLESESRTWSDGHTSLVNYNIHFFDTQTNTLFYFHNNI